MKNSFVFLCLLGLLFNFTLEAGTGCVKYGYITLLKNITLNGEVKEIKFNVSPRNDTFSNLTTLSRVFGGDKVKPALWKFEQLSSDIYAIRYDGEDETKKGWYLSTEGYGVTLSQNFAFTQVHWRVINRSRNRFTIATLRNNCMLRLETRWIANDLNQTARYLEADRKIAVELFNIFDKDGNPFTLCDK